VPSEVGLPFSAIEEPGCDCRSPSNSDGGLCGSPALGPARRPDSSRPRDGPPTPWAVAPVETVTYHELWDRAGAIASALTNDPEHPVRPATASASWASPGRLHDHRRGADQWARCPFRCRPAHGHPLQPIVVRPTRRDRCERRGSPDAVELVLTGHAPSRWSCSTTTRGRTTTARRSKPLGRVDGSGQPGSPERLADVLEPERRSAATPLFDPTTMTTR